MTPWVLSRSYKTKPREASTLIFRIRSCAVRSDLKNKHEISRKCFIFKIRLTVQDRILKIRVLASLGNARISYRQDGGAKQHPTLRVEGALPDLTCGHRPRKALNPPEGPGRKPQANDAAEEESRHLQCLDTREGGRTPLRKLSNPRCSFVSNSLMGSFGNFKGSLQKNFRKFPRNFRKTFHRISAPFPDAIARIFCKFP